VGTLALKGLSIFRIQLDGGLLEAEAVAHNQTRHPSLSRQVLFRSVDCFQDIELVLIPESQMSTAIHEQCR
jgi:hypothetical protein